MTFSTISEETKVQLDEIEHLIMKALSLGLLRGSIDQVAEVARISWVQPKVLDRNGIDGMKVRLREWSGGVERLGNWIEGAFLSDYPHCLRQSHGSTWATRRY